MVTEDDRLQQIEDRSLEERNLRIALGKRISQLRKKKRWTQARLALKLGATRLQLTRWEQGTFPPLRMLILLSQILETPLDVLLTGREGSREEVLSQDQKSAAVKHLNQLAGLLQVRLREARD